MCVNNKMYEEECIRYINRLNIPEGYEIDQISVWEAESMTAGYQAAMEASDAKYKVYLHQDVFIVDHNFIYRMLEVFEEPDIGMLGMVGSPELPEDGVMWSGERVGIIFSSNIKEAGIAPIGDILNKYQEVEAVDGLLIATQYDIPWRKDLFTGWDFYDISQSMEFRKNGYKIAVLGGKYPEVLHDDGFVNLITYFRWRDIFLNEYAHLIKGR